MANGFKISDEGFKKIIKALRSSIDELTKKSEDILFKTKEININIQDKNISDAKTMIDKIILNLNNMSERLEKEEEDQKEIQRLYKIDHD